MGHPGHQSLFPCILSHAPCPSVCSGRKVTPVPPCHWLALGGPFGSNKTRSNKLIHAELPIALFQFRCAKGACLAYISQLLEITICIPSLCACSLVSIRQYKRSDVIYTHNEALVRYFPCGMIGICMFFQSFIYSIKLSTGVINNYSFGVTSVWL